MAEGCSHPLYPDTIVGLTLVFLPVILGSGLILYGEVVHAWEEGSD